jgi:hypothetical protein
MKAIAFENCVQCPLFAKCDKRLYMGVDFYISSESCPLPDVPDLRPSLSSERNPVSPYRSVWIKRGQFARESNYPLRFLSSQGRMGLLS